MSEPLLKPAWEVTWPFGTDRPVWACGEVLLPDAGRFILQGAGVGEGRVLWFAREASCWLECEGDRRLSLEAGEWLLGPSLAETRVGASGAASIGYLWSPGLSRMVEQGFERARPMSRQARAHAERLHACLDCPVPGRFGCWRLSTELLDALLEPAPEKESEDVAIARALAILGQAEESFPSLPEIAAECGLSASQFARRFRQAIGMNFREYLTRERLRRARVLLESGRANVTEAAFVAGYGEVSQFSRAFRKHYGTPPSELRKKSEA